MSEWLDVMLEELARKRREAEEARAEQARREPPPLPAGDQPK
jgi:hypothetical protein